MVCCFAAVEYTGCGHRQVFKIDCTRDCTSRCQPQEILLETQACFACERCLEAQSDKKARERALAAMQAKLAALETQESQDSLPSHTQHQYTAYSRDGWDNEWESAKLAARVSEASYAENWTFEVAELVWQLKYGGCEDVEAVERSLDKQMERKPWDVQVVKKSNWTNDTVDSSEESDPATTEDNNAGQSPESPTTTSIPWRADHELMPPPPLPIGTRAPRTNLSDWELMPIYKARGPGREHERSPAL
ncbi:hypothetical protein MY11210_005675 [Beauveria gryllotalpidicola]